MASYYTALRQENGQADKFVRVMQNTLNMIKIFQAFKKTQLQSGKPDDSPEIAYIDKKIGEFENDLRILKVQYQAQSAQ